MTNDEKTKRQKREKDNIRKDKLRHTDNTTTRQKDRKTGRQDINTNMRT